MDATTSVVDMRKNSNPRGEGRLQAGLNSGQEPRDELKDYADNEKYGQGGTVHGIEEKKESDVCDRYGREEKEYGICDGGDNREKENTRNLPILTESDKIIIDDILRKSIVKPSKPASTELAELTEKIKQGDTKALKTLIAALSYGKGVPVKLSGGENLDGLGLKRGPEVALHAHKIAANIGVAASQHAIAVSLALERGEESSSNDLAVLYEYFATLGGDWEAHLAMGDRYLNGRGVSENCQTALIYYAAASEAVLKLRRVVPNAPVDFKDRLSEMNRKHLYPTTKKAFELPETRGKINFLLHNARNGNLRSLVSAGLLYLQGSRIVPRDEIQAASFFQKAVDLGDSVAAGLLGQMYLKGVEVEQNFHTAIRLFRLGEADQDPTCLTGLGYMHAKGLVVNHDLNAARKYFQEACMNQFASSEPFYYMGLLLSGEEIPDFGTSNDDHAVKDEDSTQEEGRSKNGTSTTSGASKDTSSKSPGSSSIKKNGKLAVDFFSDAHKQGLVDSSHYLGMMITKGEDVRYDCVSAVHHFKMNAEAGPWGELLQIASNLYNTGSYDIALNLYLRLGEAGYELAQSNAAWMMENGHCAQLGDETCTQLAVQMYTRAAAQNRPEAYLRLGNLYYSGWRLLKKDPLKSMKYYESAAGMNSAQAMFNLGWMYQTGWGVSQDFEHAKEYYTKCMDTSPQARVPALLSLKGMHVHMKCKHLIANILPMVKEGNVDVNFASIEPLLEGAVAIETVLLGILCVLLLLVLWVRRSLRRRCQAAAGGIQ